MVSTDGESVDIMEAEGKKKVCIVGLGYVGLPLASLSSRYFSVTGFDINTDKVTMIQQGKCPIDDTYTKTVFEGGSFVATTSPEVIKDAEIIVVCVPTPVDEKHHPDLSPLESAMGMVAEHLCRGQLVIVESTIYPGTMEEVVIPILEGSRLQAGRDFGVAYCAERIDPGNEKWVLGNITRVLAGLTTEDAERAKQFYQTFIDAEVKVLGALKSAEAVKILENTFRDVNIAFINEMAKSFDELGINLLEVIEGAATKPFGFMPFYPGPGVGGHCIPVDPYYLIERAKQKGFDHEFLNLARRINLSMPNYVVQVLQEALNEMGLALSNARIGVLGLAYKKGIDDVRESPAVKIVERLKCKKASIEVFDPYLLGQSTVDNAVELFGKVDVVLLLTNHDEFNDCEEKLISAGIKVVVDTRNLLNPQTLKRAGVVYRGIGRN